MIRLNATKNAVVFQGRTFGGFETETLAREWLNTVNKSKLIPVSAGELFLGLTEHEAIFGLNEFNLEMDMHPWFEIFDFNAETDNGHVILITAGRDLRVVSEDVVYIDGRLIDPPKWDDRDYEARVAYGKWCGRQTDLEVGDFPSWVHIKKEHICHVEPMHAPAHGDLLVIRNPEEHRNAKFLVAWRRDGRQKMWLTTISGHTFEHMAVRELKTLLREYVPPEDRQKNSRYDFQKSRVYQWESRVANKFLTETLTPEQCVIYMHEVYNGIGYKGKRHTLTVLARRTTTSVCKWNSIELAEEIHTNRGSIIHEVAHHITDVVFGDRISGKKLEHHGPEYVGVYMYMLNRLADIPIDILTNSAINMNVTFIRMVKLF